MKKKVFSSIDELLEYAILSKNVPFSEIDKNHRLSSGKGSIGQIMEESYFGYEINSRHEPDFVFLGVELKVTPFIKNTRGYRAKERLVLGLINYQRENWDDFYKSEFWAKNQKILIMFYEHRNDIPKELWSIFDMHLYDFPENDLLIIKNDWSIIADKVKAGLAHQLSEGDTLYLGACTKGATAASSFVKQPYSSEFAKGRAYSFKNSYMTYILNKYIFNENHEIEKIIKDPELLRHQSFESYVQTLFAKYRGLTQQELINILKVTPSKSTNASIVNKILNINGDLKQTEEFQKGHIIPKTIRIESNGSIKESMSFPSFDFKEIISSEWEESEFYTILAEARFMFIVFTKCDDREETSCFSNVYFWSMSEKDISEAFHCWHKTKQVIKTGVILTTTQKGICNNLPKSSENRVAHVRPHANKSAYKFNNFSKGELSNACELPDGRWMTKQCFWLNSNYIQSIINNLIK